MKKPWVIVLVLGLVAVVTSEVTHSTTPLATTPVTASSQTSGRPTTPSQTSGRPTTPSQTSERPTTPSQTSERPTTPSQTSGRPTTPSQTSGRPTTPSPLIQAIITNPLFQSLAANLLAMASIGRQNNGSSLAVGNTTHAPVQPLPGQQSPNIPGLLAGSPFLQDAFKIVVEEMTIGMQAAQAANQTVGMGIGQMLGTVNKLRTIMRILGSRSASSILPHAGVGDQCYMDIVDTLDSLVVTKKWAIDMFDALGKPSAGIQRGSFYFHGAFDQCYMIKPHITKGDVLGTIVQDKSRDFGTRFCRSDIGIPQSLIDSLNVDTKGVHLKVIIGMCVPDSCNKRDVQNLLSAAVTIEDTYCYGEQTISSDTSAIVCIVILSLFGTLIALGTLYDVCRSRKQTINSGLPLSQNSVQNGKQKTSDGQMVARANDFMPINGDIKVSFTETSGKTNDLPPGYMPHKEGHYQYPQQSNGTAESVYDNLQHQPTSSDGTKEAKNASKQIQNESTVERLALCFSLYSNIPKILAAKSNPGAASCIHGIRFLSLTWVVLGHTYNYGIVSMDETFTAGNLLDFVPIMQRFTFQGVLAAGFAVDTFFVLSAFLLTWLHLKEQKKKKSFTAMDGFFYFFHRFWRLTPIYMMVMMMFACLYRYLGTGPFWPSTIWGAEHCKTVWWTNLLYVNNLVGTGSQCMGWTWYLANDMQFYVITPIFLFLLYKFAVCGVVSTFCLLTGGIAIAFWKEHVYNGNFFTMKSDDGAYWNNVYTVPWCRVSPWAIGILLGYVVYRRGNRPINSKLLVYAGWLLATGVALTLTYINYTELQEDGTPWTREYRATYESFGRALWGACIAWMIFACHTGSGGIVNSILSWNGFIPLSRLSYAAYLVHPICMMTYMFSRRALLHVTDYSIIYLFLGHLCVTYMVAFVCSLSFEAPFMGLEKVLFRSGGKRR